MHSNFLFSGHDEFSDITNSLSVAVVYFVQIYRIMSSTNNDNFTISFWILTLTLLHWLWPSVQCWIDLMMVAIQASVSRKVFLSTSPLTLELIKLTTQFLHLFKETLYQNNEVSFYFQFIKNFVIPVYRISTNTFTSFIYRFIFIFNVIN